MKPELFKIGDFFTVYAYGFFIAIGAILGVTYVAIQARKRFNISFDTINTLFLLLIVAAVVGGKVFLFFEKPGYYTDNPSALFTGKGFVFYGSLIFTIPTMLIFFKKHNLPTLPMLDIMAVTTCIVHIFGRIGCFMAGCCYGIEWHGPLSVIFTDDQCLAPLNAPLHPTQLYSVTLITIILIILLVIKRNKAFEGQLFILYLMLYAIGRSIIEIFRGDESRGYIIENVLSHSQFIALILFLIALYFYIRLSRQQKDKGSHTN